MDIIEMRDVVGYEGYYKVTNDGNIWSVKRKKYLSLNHKKNGYVYIELNRRGEYKTVRVHRLVAQAFIPNPFGKETVNHINCNKSDNRVENLEWATVSENTIHAYQNGLVRDMKIAYSIVSDTINVTVMGMQGLREATGYKNSRLIVIMNEGKLLKRGVYKGCSINKQSLYKH